MEKYCLDYFLFEFLKSTKKADAWKDFEYEILFQKGIYGNLGRDTPIPPKDNNDKRSEDDRRTIREDFDYEKRVFRQAFDNILEMFSLQNFRNLFHNFMDKRFTFEEIVIIFEFYAKYTYDSLWKSYFRKVFKTLQKISDVSERDLFNAVENRYQYLNRPSKVDEFSIEKIDSLIISLHMEQNSNAPLSSKESTLDTHKDLDCLNISQLLNEIKNEVQWVIDRFNKLLKNHLHDSDVTNIKTSITNQIVKATGINPNRQSIIESWQIGREWRL